MVSTTPLVIVVIRRPRSSHATPLCGPRARCPPRPHRAPPARPARTRRPRPSGSAATTRRRASPRTRRSRRRPGSTGSTAGCPTRVARPYATRWARSSTAGGTPPTSGAPTRAAASRRRSPGFTDGAEKRARGRQGAPDQPDPRPARRLRERRPRKSVSLDILATGKQARTVTAHSSCGSTAAATGPGPRPSAAACSSSASEAPGGSSATTSRRDRQWDTPALVADALALG